MIKVRLTKAIEENNFPFEDISEIAQLESWRKEIYRPVYHIHKWWARRLGSIFRAILIATFAPEGANLLEMLEQPINLKDRIIFDPFMGSGTTIGEGLKLGAYAIGRDINPVASFLVKNALTPHSREEVIATFDAIKKDVADQINYFYRVSLGNGEIGTVLYYFWVKVVSCPQCDWPVNLFSSYIFARHAYPKKYPEARAICPHCEEINTIRYDAQKVTCQNCDREFEPQKGPASHTKATCSHCGHKFTIIKAVQQQNQPPAHRLYAKLVLLPDGTKKYLPINEYDCELYKKAASLLHEHSGNAYPIVAIEPGENTNQILNYCYRYWHQMFNDRQLLALNILGQRIRQIPDKKMRDLFICLFSGTLEFNNMFASYKGEGTGAVRHLFSHHILKPERQPIEANLWGTPKSSGAFSTLFESRILRAIDYCDRPFEIKPMQKNGKTKAEKIYGISHPLGHKIAENFAEFKDSPSVYLSCGDSAKTDIASESVDAVVTDPPFFDNVHYSQLADFFHVWQQHILSDNPEQITSTRSPAEVQTSDRFLFAERLRGVWQECHRVLRSDGLLVFTYHHSRVEGWRSILEALVGAGFVITAAHPIKSEMSVATPKSQAKEPIDLDAILVCRKRTATSELDFSEILTVAQQTATKQIFRFNKIGRYLNKGDRRIILMAQIIKLLSGHSCLKEAIKWLDTEENSIEMAIAEIGDRQKELF